MDLRSWWVALRLGATTDSGVYVITYHGVVDRFADRRLERNFVSLAEFKAQVRLLRRFRVVSLAEVESFLAGGASLGRRVSVAVTFDDGYKNNLRAAEILQAAGLPWTLFLSAGSIDAQTPIWTASLSLLLLCSAAKKVDAIGRSWSLSTIAEREHAFQEIRQTLKTLPAIARRKEFAAILRQSPDEDWNRIRREHAVFEPLSWAEVRELSRAGVEIASHGIDHEIHHALQTPMVRREELTESKELIEGRLGRACRYFAFPNGTTNPDSNSEARSAGYRLAFTTQPGAVGRASDPFSLPRIEAGSKVRSLVNNLLVDRSIRTGE